MNQEPHFSAYGTSILPIIVASAKAGRLPDETIRQFVKATSIDVEVRIQRTATDRRALNATGISRSDRLSAGRYFDMDLRVRKAQRLALLELEKYLADGHKHWLDQALLQFETAERFRQTKIKLRLSLPTMLCERLTRVGTRHTEAA